ncbi:MAG: RNA-binding protein, partial [Phormidesmis sp.]
MEKSISWLEKLLTLQGLQTSVSGTQMTGDLGDDSFWLTIDTEPLTDAQVEGLIGDRGQVLDSIQYLANTTLNMGQQADAQQSYTIEINGYRKQRQAA